MGIRDDLIRDEEEAWAEFWGVAGSMSPEQLLADGYYPGWSAKDLLAHIGSWLAEGAIMLERIRMGTYEGWDEDTDALNEQWFEIWRDVELGAVLAHLHSSRARLLEEWSWLPEDRLDQEAIEWFEEAAPHYRDHLGRLREWAAEVDRR